MPTPPMAEGRPTVADVQLEDSDLKRKVIAGAKIGVAAVAFFVAVTEGASHIGNDEVQMFTQSVEILTEIGVIGKLSLRAIHAIETGQPD